MRKSRMGRSIASMAGPFGAGALEERATIAGLMVLVDTALSSKSGRSGLSFYLTSCRHRHFRQSARFIQVNGLNRIVDKQDKFAVQSVQCTPNGLYRLTAISFAGSITEL